MVADDEGETNRSLTGFETQFAFYCSLDYSF